MLKAIGYGISTLSAVLLGVVAWDRAKHDPVLVIALLGGIALALAGMGFRLLAHIRERDKDRRLN